MLTESYFQIEQSGCSIGCKRICNSEAVLDRVVLFAHGFGGHRDNRAASRFAKELCSHHEGAAVITFDLPCHGSDKGEILRLSDCLQYFAVMADYLQKTYPKVLPDACATSFGGYLLLNYIITSGNPFRRIALRCPAVNMHQVLTNSIMAAEAQEQLYDGKVVEVGFDRKIPVDLTFAESLKQADIMTMVFTPFAGDILILHGRKDEVVPFAAGQTFAYQNGIRFLPAANADHRYSDPKIMAEAIRAMEKFFDAPDRM